MKKMILAGCITFLFACSNTDEFDANLDKQVSKPADPSAVNATQPTQTMSPSPIITPSQPQINTTPVVTSTAQTTTAPGMNPPHGQPGHRCDIAVGAPLNASPKTKTATVPQQNVVVTPTTTTAPTTTAPGMNPPHGQPGHRCDISVGAPLNSTPNKPGETKTAIQPLQPLQPTTKDSSKN